MKEVAARKNTWLFSKEELKLLVEINDHGYIVHVCASLAIISVDILCTIRIWL